MPYKFLFSNEIENDQYLQQLDIQMRYNSGREMDECVIFYV